MLNKCFEVIASPTSATEAFPAVLVVVFVAYFVIVNTIKKDIAKSKSRSRKR